MRRAHKLLSLLLVLTLALSLGAPVGAAYSDTSGHWAESAIDRWSAYGIVSGDGNGFNPDGNLTRGQMAKVLAETLGLTKQAEQNPFADVSADAWYTPYILRCYEAGIMQGDGANASPDATITREQAMVMLCRALDIAPAGGEELDSFADSGSVADWAAPYVAAMVKSGIVGGVGNNSLAPTGDISRAALMTILDRSVVQYINAPGSYELTDKAGIVLVAAGDVTLTGSTSADVLVSPAAEGKAVAFNGATVTGSVTVQAEAAKVTSENSRLPDVSFTATISGKVEIVTPTEPTKPTEPTRPTSTPTGGGSGSSGDGGSSHTHSWGEGVVTTEPTATTAGVKTFTCTGCGQTRTESIAPTGEPEIVSDYVYASHFGPIDADGAFDADGDALGAKVYYDNGTSEVVTVNTSYGDSTNNPFSDQDLTEVDEAFNDNHVGIYKLEMKNGSAVLSLPGTDILADGSKTITDDVAIADKQVKRSISTIVVDSVEANKIKADGKTVFFYVNYSNLKNASGSVPAARYWNVSDFTVIPYVGINNVRVSKDNNATVEKYIAGADFATKQIAGAVLVFDTMVEEPDDTVYFYTGNYDENVDGRTVTYETYVNGELTDLVITYDSEEHRYDAIHAFRNVKNQFFTLSRKNLPVQDTLVEWKDKNDHTKWRQSKEIRKFCYEYGLEIEKTDLNTDIFTFNAKIVMDFENVFDPYGNMWPVNVQTAPLSRNGNRFAYGDPDADTKVIDLTTGKPVSISSPEELERALGSWNAVLAGDLNAYNGYKVENVRVAVQYANNSSNTVSCVYITSFDDTKLPNTLPTPTA